MLHGYVRVSTDGQNDGSSPEDQEHRIRLIAQFREQEPTIWRDTVSGSVPVSTRPAGSQMINQLRSGDTIVAAKLDRLFRNAEDALARSRAWREIGVDLILCDMGPDPVTTSAAGRLYFGMLAQFAEFERERINERTREGRAAKRARGGFAGGNAPLGQRAVGQGRDAVLEPNEVEMRMVERARFLAPALRSPTRIAEKLNNEGFLSRAGTPIVAAQVWRWIR